MSTNLRMMCGTAVLITISGCGSDIEHFDRAPVTGRVMCQDEPVALARVAFNPVRQGKSANVGKQGLGLTDIDGTFTLGTYEESDGAVIGKHSVRVWMDGAPCDCVVGDMVEVQQVEVVSGQDNHFEIVLKEATAKERRRQDAQLNDEFDD